MLTDPRVTAFCSGDGPEIFRPVAYPTEVWYPDPLDVEAIYADARELYELLLRRATAPDSGQKVGRILLLRGESGSGKTHLMRAFRTRTHQLALGYFGYMQMTTSSGNYSRYILQKLIDSLDQPYYTTPASPDITTGLMRLSTAVAESTCLAREKVQRLLDDELEHDERAALVLDLADDAVCDPLLRDTPLDLVRSMLFLQSRHPAIRSRVMKYLRAESLSDHDRQRLGGISPLDRDESAQDMIERLGRLMWTVHGAALILCVDQLEDIALYDGAEDKFRRAIKGLTQVAAQVPSSLIVIACLEDYYDKLRGHLDKSALDRLENDPAPLTLPGGRTWDEIRAIVALHLNYLFEMHEVPISDQRSTDPMPAAMLRAQVKQTTRTVLTTCKVYRDACVRAGRLVTLDEEGAPAVSPAPARDDQEAACQKFDQDWNDFLVSFEQRPLEDDQRQADLLAESIELCSDETESGCRFTTDSNGLETLVFIVAGEGDDRTAHCLVRLCNNAPRGGSLGKQIEGLLKLAGSTPPGTTPVVVRCTEYQPKTPKSAIAGLFAQLYAQAGRYVIVRDSDWRIMAAIQQFRLREQEKPHFGTWLRRAQPLVRLKSLRDVLALDAPTHRWERPAVVPSDPGVAADTAHAAAGENADHAWGESGPDERECGAIAAAGGHGATTQGNTELLVGHSRNRAQQPMLIPIESMTLHTAFLGSTGSGKTTAALNLIEQLLLRGIPALLV
ncbi:MAG: AAA family ATPase, partial [Pirellulaceae bacterium]|nr:AAA family ATPase [Pirellulaceae bacterium]